MSETDLRNAVLAEAMLWRGTPFHDNAAVRGAGVDCAHFCHACYVAAGMIPPVSLEYYSPQHMLHRDEEIFLTYTLSVGAREIDPDSAQPADLILYKIARVYAHGALVVDWPRSIIHAHKQSGSVLITGPRECDLVNRDIRAFTFW